MLPLTKLLIVCTAAAAVAAQYQHGGSKSLHGHGPLRVDIPVGSRFVGRGGHDCGCGRRVQQSSNDDFGFGSLSTESGNLGQSGLGSEMSTDDVAGYRGEQSDVGLGSGMLAGQSDVMDGSMNTNGQSGLSGIGGQSGVGISELDSGISTSGQSGPSGSEDGQIGSIVGQMGTLGQGHTAARGTHSRHGAHHRHIVQSIIRGIQSGSLAAHFPRHSTHSPTHGSQIQSNNQDQATAQPSTPVGQSTSQDVTSSSHARVQSGASSGQFGHSGHSGSHSSSWGAASSSHGIAQSRASSGSQSGSQEATPISMGDLSSADIQSGSQDLDISDHTNSNSQDDQSSSEGGESAGYEEYSRGPWGRRGRYQPRITA